MLKSAQVLSDLLCFQIFYHSFIVSRDVQYPVQRSVGKTFFQLIPAFCMFDVLGERLCSCFSTFVSSPYMNTIENNKADLYQKKDKNVACLLHQLLCRQKSSLPEAFPWFIFVSPIKLNFLRYLSSNTQQRFVYILMDSFKSTKTSNKRRYWRV